MTCEIFREQLATQQCDECEQEPVVAPCLGTAPQASYTKWNQVPFYPLRLQRITAQFSHVCVLRTVVLGL